MIDRRRFLEGLGGLAALSALRCGSAEEPASGLAPFSGPWGAAHPEHEFALLPADRRPKGILEVFMLGGMTPWETFYTVPEHCRPEAGGPYAGQQWHGFQHPQNGLSVPDWFAACNGSGPLLADEHWGLDGEQKRVFLGPFIHPLRDRPDILKRMRVWVMSHDVEPHEIGIPLAVTGHRLGNPRMATIGAHIQRFFRERADRTAPYSYSVYMSALQLAAAGRAASAVGLHRASARPMEIMLSADTQLPKQLPRPTVDGYRPELDAVVQHYLGRYAKRFDRPGATGALRSPGLADYSFARATMENHEILTRLLPADLLRSIDVQLCLPEQVPDGPGDVVLDEVDTGLRVAAHLLTDPADPARYVQFMDSGIYTDPAGQGYDAHGAHVIQSAPNLVHMLRSLTRVINEPGENDPNKIDLDQHFVMLNTEFGRAPFPEVSPRNPHGGGTDHWPWGYVVVGFGSFVDEDHRGIVGAIGENGRAISSLTPAEHRAALLLAMGIWPFTEESFAVRDVRDVETELDAALWLRANVLGYEA